MNELNMLNLGVVTLLISLFGYLCYALMGKNPILKQCGWLAMLASLLSLAGSLAFRSISAQYFALSNMYESMLVLIIWLQLSFLVIDARFKLPALGWPVALVLLVALAYDTTLSRDIHPLQAALQSYWRSIHVPLIILSYALFTLSFISATVYLTQLWWTNRKQLTVTEKPSALPPSPLHSYQADEPPGQTDAVTNKTLSLAQALQQEGANVYDEVTYRCVIAGFPLLIIGIILGGLWANEAWGNYWSWDPKESMSLATLLAYGVYLHLRINGEHSAKTLSWVAVGAFAMLLITYFGVNMMGLGLHSYGKIS
jgi:cytochrome c-type biogenesis protein CcsB